MALSREDVLFSQDLIDDIRPSTNPTKSLKLDFSEESMGGFDTLPYPPTLVTLGLGEGRLGEDYLGEGDITEPDLSSKDLYSYNFI